MKDSVPAGWTAALVVAVLLVPAALAQAPGGGWTQLAGGADRSAAATLPEGPLDVVSTLGFAGGSTVNPLGAGVVTTPQGALMLIQYDLALPDATCRLARIPDLAAPVPSDVGPAIPCIDGGRVVGYDAARDAVVLCIDGAPGDPILRAWDARTGAERWTTGPAVGPVETRGAADQNEWLCGGVALLEDEAIVPFSTDVGRHVVQAVSLVDGSTNWSARVGVSDTLIPPGTLPPVPGSEQQQAFIAQTVTVTDTGLVVAGFIPPTRSALAWTDLAGNLIGTRVAGYSLFHSGNTQGGTPLDMTGSLWAASRGARAASIIGTEIVFVNPLNLAPEVVPLPPGSSGFVHAAWYGEIVALPLATTVMLYDSTDPSRTQVWSGNEGGAVVDLVFAPPSDLYVATSRVTASGLALDLTRVDLASGRSVQTLPLPFGNVSDAIFRLAAVEDGLVAFLASTQGAPVVFLGVQTALAAPEIEASTEYPAVGEALDVVARTPPGADRVSLAWGDGVVEPPADGVASHQYDEAGRRTLRATAVYPDGRTATSERVVFVGATPPEDLNFMQRAFAPENQETTYAVAGLALTLLGAAVATFEKRRRRGRVGREIHELHRIRDLAGEDVPAALRHLHAFHVRLERDHATGALDDGQFGALELREARLRETLRSRVLGPVAGRVTPRFLRALDAAFEDGRLEPQEAQALALALAAERNLTEEERQQLAALFAAWARAGEA